MFNIPPLHSSKTIDVKIIPAVLKTWQIGQIFESRAKTSSDAQGKFLLQIGQNVINAKTTQPILAGEELKLQVSKLGPEPLLKVLTPAIKADPVNLYLRQAVPQANSIQKLINLINKVQHLVPEADAAEATIKTVDKALTEMSETGTKATTKIVDKTLTGISEASTKATTKAVDKTLTGIVEASTKATTKIVDKLVIETLSKPMIRPFELKTLVKQMNVLLQTPVKADNISSDSIQRFLQQSGFNFENKLMNKEVPVNDLKLNLIQLKQSVDQILTNTRPQPITKNPEIISTLTSEYRLPAIASYLLYGIPPAEKASIISYLTQLSGFSSTQIDETQSFVFQAIQKLTKNQTAQLKQWIQFLPTLPEIRQLIEQSISTITNHQLQALQADSQADSAFLVLFNLLVLKNTDWIDLFNVKISKQEADDEKLWSVTIQLEMSDLGLIQAKLVMVKKQLHAGLTSESNTTHLLINEHLNLLQSALTLAGFDVATLSSKQDKIQPIDKDQPGHGPLLEDKA